MRTSISLPQITVFATAACFNTKKASNQAKEKLRVLAMSDFPLIGVVKGGDDVPNTLKSDPDDMH